MKITAVIPIRKGSQRVKDKNLRPFAGTSLLEIKINTLLQVPEIDEIIVNTDSEQAIALVETLYSGTKVKYHRREGYYAASECPGSEFFKHLGEVTDTDVFIYSPCTSPLVKPETISSCVRRFIQNLEDNSDYDCVSTVSEVKEFLWLDGKALNYDPLNAPNSQNLPEIVALNFGTTVVKRDDLIRNRNIIGKKPDFVVTKDMEAIDIDTPFDFYVAEQLYQRLVVQNKDIID